MRVPVRPLVALGLAGFGLWGVWPVFAAGLGMAGLSAARPSGLWAMGVPASLGLATGVCLAALVGVAREKQDERAGTAWCVLVLGALLAFAGVLLLLQGGQPLRCWFVLADHVRNGSPLSRGLESMALLLPCYALLWARAVRAGREGPRPAALGSKALAMTAAALAAWSLGSLLSPDLSPLDSLLGVAAGTGMLFWLPGSGQRMRGVALAHVVLSLFFFARLGLHAHLWEACGSLAQWAGISLALAAALGSGLLGRRVLFKVKRG